MAGLRATLASGVASNYRDSELEFVQTAVNSACLNTGKSASAVRSIRLSDFLKNTLDTANLSYLEGALSAARSAAFTDREVPTGATRQAIDLATQVARSVAKTVADESAALDARFDAVTPTDAEQLEDRFSLPLWPSSKAVEPLLVKWRAFEAQPDASKTWDFWRTWYRGMLDGRPMDWDLQYEVAMIDDAVWEDGPEAVAEAIRDIQWNDAGPAPLEETVLRKHVEYLLKNPVLSEATALNGAETVERAISDYLSAAPANCLPEDLRHLEALPQHFKAIARVIGSQTSNDQKENQLTDEISKLHARVAALEKELAVAKSKELKGVISQEAAKSFGKTIGSPWFWSGAAVSVGYFFGVAPSDMTLENFRNYVEELLRVNVETAPAAQPRLPSSIDV